MKKSARIARKRILKLVHRFGGRVDLELLERADYAGIFAWRKLSLEICIGYVPHTKRYIIDFDLNSNDAVMVNSFSDIRDILMARIKLAGELQNDSKI